MNPNNEKTGPVKGADGKGDDGKGDMEKTGGKADLKNPDGKGDLDKSNAAHLNPNQTLGTITLWSKVTQTNIRICHLKCTINNV